MFNPPKKRKQKWHYKRNFRKNYIKELKPKENISITKIFLFILIFIFYFSIHPTKKSNTVKLNIKKESKTKICICTLAKEENLYVREYLEHYQNYGISKVYLHDNNDVNGEKFEDVIDDYIKSGFVEVENWRGKRKVQFKMMNDCYKKHKEEYDWVMFSDLDEFVHLYNYTDVGTFLNEPRFNNCEIVYFTLVCHSDNEQLHYENKPVKERFPNVVPSSKKGGRHFEIKFVLRGHLNVSIYCVHRGNMGMKNNCNTYGHANKYSSIFSKEPDTTYYYYDHYYSKSTEEFIKKIIRGDSENYHDQFRKGRIQKYFEENTITLEKIIMMENATKFDLSKYKSHLEK